MVNHSIIYTYVLNNPLRFVDPSGYRPVGIFEEEARMTSGSKSSVGSGWDPFGWMNNGMNGWTRKTGPNTDWIYSSVSNSSVNRYTGERINHGTDTERYNEVSESTHLEYNYWMTGDILNIHITGTKSSPVSNTTNNGVPGYEDDVSGFGLSIEFAVPRWLIIRKNDYSGAGIDFGILRDSKGFGFYATTKTTMRDAWAASIQLEGFGAIQRSSSFPNIDRTYLHGPGYEVGFGVLIVGGQYSTDNSSDFNMTPDWHMTTFSIGPGLDFGYVNWNTNTYVSGRRKF